MGITSILSEFQKETLSLFKKTPLAKSYYLAGGTALAEYYLHHRKSEDLDFFTQKEVKTYFMIQAGKQRQKILH